MTDGEAMAEARVDEGSGGTHSHAEDLEDRAARVGNVGQGVPCVREVLDDHKDWGNVERSRRTSAERSTH